MVLNIYKYCITLCTISSFIAGLDTLFNSILRPYHIHSIPLGLSVFGHNFVSYTLLLILSTSLLSLVFLAIKASIGKWRKINIPWALIFGFCAASFVVFGIAVLLNVSVLPSFRALISKQVNGVLLFSVPILAFGFTYLGGKLRKLYSARAFYIVTLVFCAISLFATAAGYLLPAYGSEVVTGDLDEPPNILIITLDALRRDYVSYYDCGPAYTPNLDNFAEKCTVYEHAYTPNPWTIPSMYSMLTSSYPSVHGADDVHRGNDNSVSLATVLRAYGYTTEAYIANSTMDRELGFDRGFDIYLLYEDTPWLMWVRHSTLYLFVSRLNNEESYFTPPADTTKWLTELLIKKIQKKRDRPFFIWAHYLDPHSPLTPPLKYARENLAVTDDVKRIIEAGGHYQKREYCKKLYEAEVEYVDDSLGRVFDTLKENGLYDNTVIIITADHGEELFEHGQYGHSRTHYNEVMAVPLFIYVPGAKHFVDNGGVSIIDIMPTVLGHIGIGGDYQLSGSDIIGSWNTTNINRTTDFAPVFFDRTYYNHTTKSICVYPFTLTRTGDTDYDYEMVDIRIGKGPSDIVSEPAPELFAKYRSELDLWADKTAEEAAELGEAREVDLDNIRKERLEGLGYF